MGNSVLLLPPVAVTPIFACSADTIAMSMTRFEKKKERKEVVNPLFFSTSFIPCGIFVSPYHLGKATAVARSALPIPNSACGIFMCPNKGMSASAWDY